MGVWMHLREGWGLQTLIPGNHGGDCSELIPPCCTWLQGLWVTKVVRCRCPGAGKLRHLHSLTRDLPVALGGGTAGHGQVSYKLVRTGSS